MFGFNINIVTEYKGLNMLVSFNPYANNSPNFKALSNTKKVYDYLMSIADKKPAEISQELLSKIATAKTEGKMFEVGMLEARARKLGLIK